MSPLRFALLLAPLGGCAPKAMDRSMDIAPTPVAIPDADATQLARGEYIARNVAACTRCHGDDLGGDTYVDAFPMGTVVAGNLTPAVEGLGEDYSDGDWVRAIRHGVGADGRPLIIMPSYDYIGLSEQDLGDMIAWLKTLPPIERELPRQKLGPVGKRLVESGRWVISADMMDHSVGFEELEEGQVARGRYLARVASCTSCHGSDFVGRSFGPGGVWSTNITPHRDGIQQWSEEDFVRAMREGVRPDGTAIDPFMPWEATAGWSDEDLSAMYAYLNTLLPLPDRD